MSKTVITISREFGSGGRYVGEHLANRLGYELYDRDLIARVAEHTLLPESVVSTYNEALETDRMVGSFYFGNTNLNDSIIEAQKKIICEIADKGNCVIVGRCSSYYLKDYKDALHVFIESDRIARLTRICQLHDCMGVEAEAMMNEYDRKRHLYYQYCTNQAWGDRMNYDIVLKSNRLGLDTCVDILTDLCNETPTL